MDYTVKHSFATLVLTHMHNSYAKFLQRELSSLINQQERITGTRGYLFGFRAYTDDCMGKPITELPPTKRPTTLLPVALHGEHYGWCENMIEHQNQWQRVSQAITSILLRAENPGDLRDLLPDYAIGPGLQHVSIIGLARSRPALYTAPPADWDKSPWDPKLMQLYADAGPLIDQYLRYSFL